MNGFRDAAAEHAAYAMRAFAVGILLLCPATVPHAAETGPREPWNTGWALHLDNDLFAFVSRDQQYTGGAVLELAGRRAAEWTFTAHRPLAALDRWTGFDHLAGAGGGNRRHSVILGVAAFTPEDIDERQPIQDDHPYGSLVLFGNARQTIGHERRTSHQSSLVFGLLGTNVAQQLQNFFHDIGDTDRARGWRNQISDGGEPTFRYDVSRERVVIPARVRSPTSFDLRTGISASVGYITQAAVGFTARWGAIRRRWWQSGPTTSDYLQIGAPARFAEGAALAGAPEWFIWAGMEGSLRLYNALLEGQFRDSEVTFSRSELRKLLGTAKVGITAELGRSGYRAEFSLRYSTPEIADAAGEEPVWGRISISRRF